MLAGWAAHALALFVWAYLAGQPLAAPVAAPANHEHSAGEHGHSGPVQHDHGTCSLCPLVAAGALAPALFILHRADAAEAAKAPACAPSHPDVRADLAIAHPRGPPALA